jgi:GNAT superfamily N-acetyltransferase
MKITIRQSQKEDMPKVLEYIQELATYEKAPNEMVNTVENLEKDGFGYNKVFDCLVAEVNSMVIGFALYYTGYSTWKGRTLYLEDFLVSENYRGKGIGKLLFNQVILEAKKRGVKRMDWQVIDWNDPAINFYKKYNAKLDGEWINGRFFEEDIRNFTIN